MRSRPDGAYALALGLALVGCGRVNFGYPIVPCEDVTASASVLSADERCYTRHDLTTSRSNAVRACQALGGHLPTITSASENAELLRLQLTAPTLIGLVTPAQASSVWEWDTNEGPVYENWGAGEPTLCTTNPSVALLAPDGTWRAGCAADPYAYPFACEIEPWLIGPDGHGYRLSWDRQDWYGATAECEAMGAHLATITSAAERATVASLIGFPVWIGASTADGVTFTWSTGEAFAYAGWGGGEPDRGGPACVTIEANNAWYDFDCSGNIRALCERD